MAIACLEKENLISIGDISEMYDISKRTLRLYHEMGLLVPAKVDEWTGYRYYEQSQTERLDLILQMKSSGLTLKQIRELLDTENLNTFEAVLGKQVEELSRKIAECRICQDSLLRKMDSFRYIRNPPPENEPFLEYIPRRPALVMDIEPYDILKEYPKGSPWKKALGVVKRIFLENDVPMALYHQISGSISRPYVKGMETTYDKAVVVLGNYQEMSLPVSYLQSGTYACVYSFNKAMDQAADLASIRLVYQYAESHGYEIIGPHLAEVIMEASYLREGDGIILVKTQVPVKMASKLASKFETSDPAAVRGR